MSNEENKQDAVKPAVDSPKDTENNQKTSQKSVMNYMMVLFAAAFCLLVLTLLMEQRANDEIVDRMYAQVDYAQNSHSQLISLHDELEDELLDAQSEIATLQDAIKSLQQDYQDYVSDATTELENAYETIAQLEETLALYQEELDEPS